MSVNEPLTQHFWAVTYPFFDSALAVRTPSIESPVTFNVYDCDGEKAHEAVLRFPAQSVTVLQCEALMKLCKIESGLKHAHIVAAADANVDIKLQLESANWSTLVSEPIVCSSGIPAFAPFVIMPERAWLAGIINFSPVTTIARIRSIVGSITYESHVTLPPYGVKVVSTSLFTDHESWQPGFGYLKVSVRGADEKVGLQLLEGALDESSVRHYGGIG